MTHTNIWPPLLVYMNRWFKKIIPFVIAGLCLPGFVSAASTRLNRDFPRTVNFYLRWELNEPNARELAKWPVVVMDMDMQVRAPELLRLMRTINPDIIILAYITPQEIRKDAPGGYSPLRSQLAAGIPEQWYLHNSSGQRLSWWPGTYLLNVTPQAPVVGGQRWTDYLVNFVTTKILSTNLWDGVFYDNAWDNITYFAGSNIDLNGDGSVDSNLDAAWRDGMRSIYRTTRQIAPRAILVGNGTTRAYQQELDGTLLENFQPASWSQTMATYRANQKAGQTMFINANTNNVGGSTNYQQMRFGLASTLLEDGYYSYDHGDQDHGQTWQYDEYGVRLGDPAGDSYALNNSAHYQPDVWRRDFARGVAIVNSTPLGQNVSLGGEYEKIRGTQDPNVNSGAIVSETWLGGYDGALLLKTVSTLSDLLFTNGGFIRFFRADGGRVRNGFFIYEDGYRGGEQILHQDLNGNGQRDLLIVSGNQILAWRDDGQPLFTIAPYGFKYTGTLNVVTADINGDDKAEIMVAPSKDVLPLKYYDLDGNPMRDDWYPLGKKYKNGFTLAVAKTGAKGETRLIVGAGPGAEPRVYVFTAAQATVRNFLAFEKAFRGGVNVAAGDVDGNGRAEIIVGAGVGKGPLVRTFNEEGNQQGKEFTAYKTTRKNGAVVRAADVDFNGQSDIIVLSPDAGI